MFSSSPTFFHVLGSSDYYWQYALNMIASHNISSPMYSVFFNVLQ